MKVEITYDNGLKKAASRIEESLGEIIAAGAEIVSECAKSLCPVDTGKLRSSITVSSSGNRAEISANTDYASYVEFGTSKAAAQPYLVPSLLGNTQAVTASILDAAMHAKGE
ncbi:MAG: HK97 gp10 family phage protein [Oscillospiraceae bacterium]|nr:HK97 gp10 family phage protein [Oscillospiraceae bacterium]